MPRLTATSETRSTSRSPSRCCTASTARSPTRPAASWWPVWAARSATILRNLREEQTHLRYPRWEAEYRLKVLREVTKYNELVLLFTTPPAHNRLSGGSEVVAELVNTYRPRLVVCAGERGVEMIGTSLTVAPGDLGDGHYAIANLHTKAAELEELAGVTP